MATTAEASLDTGCHCAAPRCATLCCAYIALRRAGTALHCPGPGTALHCTALRRWGWQQGGTPVASACEEREVVGLRSRQLCKTT